MSPAKAVEASVRVRRFRAMATDVTLQVCRPRAAADDLLDRAQAVFAEVERVCTRFDPSSPLMVANSRPRAAVPVPVVLLDALGVALHAHRRSAGMFDPRVLRELRDWGYDRTLPFSDGPVSTASAPPRRPFARRGHRREWTPQIDRAAGTVRVGEPVELGGIGKGLAVRWATTLLAAAGDAVLVEAGGDCQSTGHGPDGVGWRAGVEDPRATSTEPLAVLDISDRGCATSSVRVRHWSSGGRQVHHLVDPRTGEPGGPGLVAVTVVAGDAAEAEVLSKTLFLAGRAGIRAAVRTAGAAAMWVTDEGTVHRSRALTPHLIWEAPRAH